MPNILLEKSGEIAPERMMEPKQKQCTAVDVAGDGSKSNAVKNNIVYEP